MARASNAYGSNGADATLQDLRPRRDRCRAGRLQQRGDSGRAVPDCAASRLRGVEHGGGRIPTPSPRRTSGALQGLLPADFRGTEAHTFPVGQDMLARLAAAIGIRRRALEAAYASDHGPAFVQMYALRAAGHDPQELLDALPQAAYPERAGRLDHRRAGPAGRSRR